MTALDSHFGYREPREMNIPGKGNGMVKQNVEVVSDQIIRLASLNVEILVILAEHPKIISSVLRGGGTPSPLDHQV